VTGVASSAVSFARVGEVGVIELHSPPVNALSQPVRAAFAAAVEALDADVGIRAIVVHGRGRHFVAGADVREFDERPREPLLSDVLTRLEACVKPVIAALHGTTLGGGAELALASHYRCATRDLSFGFPEIKLGLLPGAGGTVRLPRLVGLEKALDLMTGGAPIDFDEAQTLGIVDREIVGDVRAGALAYANELLSHAAPVRPVCARPIPAPTTGTFFVDYRRALPPQTARVPASISVVEAVAAAAEGPVAAALARARQLFEVCRASAESRALRHLFFAERGGDVVGGRAVECVGVIGAGTMGSGIAISAAGAGYTVILVDTKPAALAAGLARIGATFDAAVSKGRLSAEEAEVARHRVTGAGGLEALASADLVIEAVFESLVVKREVFALLGTVCRPGAILATNTSTLDVDAIAEASGRPADVVGMHFFSPANVMRLLEIVRGQATTPDVVATTRSVARRLGKVGVVVGNCFGFVGNRMLYAYGREKELMLLEGVTPERIDRALEAFGMAMGPNAVGDLAGLDIGHQVRRAWRGRPDDPRFYRVSDLLVEHGRLGQKTGRGFYRYEANARRGVPDPEVVALIRAEANRLGVAQRTISDTEIVERCMLALINEGARVLEEGIATRAAEIDVIWCNGYGYPRHRGGPMFYADTLGLGHVLERIRFYDAEPGARYWQPAAVLEQLVRSGGTFASWTAGTQPGPGAHRRVGALI
jgi:3-hydroxyacyl-CoA dehydrogenase